MMMTMQQGNKAKYLQDRIEIKVYNTEIKSIAELLQKRPDLAHAQHIVYSLQLFGNKIHDMSHLEPFIYLVELNLSSNNIAVIKGLNMLKQLVVLNLAGNQVYQKRCIGFIIL